MMHTSKGFSLIELMIAIAIMVTLAGIGVPAFQNMVLNNRIVTTTNGLLGTLQLARSEAVTQRRQITVCPSNDQATCTADTEWEEGVLVLQGATVIRLLPGADTDVQVQSASAQIAYDTSGRLTGAATALSVLDGRGAGTTSRIVCINLLGQASSIRGDQVCP
ncbi:putative major pilin subunit [compost metagenome]